MSATPKEKAIISARRRKVAEYYLLDYNQQEIADMLEVSQGTISTDIRYILTEWKKATLNDTDTIVRRELKKLNYLEQEAVENYNIVKAWRSGDPDKPLSPQLEKWAKIRLDILKRRAQFLGLDQPTRVNIDDNRPEGQVIFYLPDNGRDPEVIKSKV